MPLAYSLPASMWPSHRNKQKAKTNKQQYRKRKGEDLKRLNVVILNFPFKIQIGPFIIIVLHPAGRKE